MGAGQGSGKGSWGRAGRAGRDGALWVGTSPGKGRPGWRGSDCEVLGALWPLSSGQSGGGVGAIYRHSQPHVKVIRGEEKSEPEL